MCVPYITLTLSVIPSAPSSLDALIRETLCFVMLCLLLNGFQLLLISPLPFLPCCPLTRISASTQSLLSVTRARNYLPNNYTNKRTFEIQTCGSVEIDGSPSGNCFL